MRFFELLTDAQKSLNSIGEGQGEGEGEGEGAVRHTEAFIHTHGETDT